MAKGKHLFQFESKPRIVTHLFDCLLKILIFRTNRFEEFPQEPISDVQFWLKSRVVK